MYMFNSQSCKLRHNSGRDYDGIVMHLGICYLAGMLHMSPPYYSTPRQLVHPLASFICDVVESHCPSILTSKEAFLILHLLRMDLLSSREGCNGQSSTGIWHVMKKAVGTG